MGRRLGVRAVVVAMMVVAALFAFSGSAIAADNSACLTCHAAAMSMPVPDVDRDTACVACHVGGLVGTHPYHQAGSNCGSACHPGWGDSLMTAVPAYTDPVSGASFTSSTSKATSPAVLHIIHSDARWPRNVDASFSACASCHAPAACTACHTGAVSAEHTDHSATGNANYPAQSPWTGMVAHGVTGGDQTQHTAGVETNQCASAGCHDIEGTKANRPADVEDYNYAAGQNPDDPTGSSSAITLTGAWRYKASSVYTGSRMSYNNVAGSALTASFTGRRVDLVSDKDPYRGKADVYIDGAKVATIDTYSASTVYQAVMFSSDTLASGSHTISVRPLNQKNTSARAAYVVVDSFRVYTDVPDSIAPECLSCHGDKSSGHGGSFSHEATHTVGTESGFACTDCHSMSMFTEHGRTSSKTSGSSCAACHTTYAPYTLAAYDFTCGGTATTLDGAPQPCHNNVGEQKHDFVDGNHDASAGANGADCKSCHGTDLSVIHTEGSARPYDTQLSGNSFGVDCLTCHSAASFPATKDCTSSMCHDASFGGAAVTMDNHTPVAHPATNNGQASVDRTGGFACSTCHTMELSGEHAKSSSITDPGAVQVTCSSCHSASYLPATWFDTPGTTNTCIACHGVGSGAPSASGAGEPHEAAEYAAKHDWSASMDVSCGGSSICHDTASVDAIHTDPLNATVSNPRGSSCETCHTTPNAVPTVSSCYDAGCHAGFDHDPAAAHDTQATPALVADNAACLTCHSTFTSLYQHVGAIGGCFGCHNRSNGALTDYLKDNYEARCVDCHNTSMDIDGAGPAPMSYAIYDPNHYEPYSTQHTASSQAGTEGGFACSTCHLTEMKPEHDKTSSAFATGDRCVECHTVKVAALGGPWDKTCDSCHAPKHTQMASKHDGAANTGCAGSGCHDVSDVAVLHDNSITTNALTPDCTVCHDSNTTVPTTTTCTDCHGGHDPAAHTALNSAACVECHETDNIQTVHAAAADGPCAVCHANPSLGNLSTGNTADCTQCHGDEVGTHVYTPVDPQHYTGSETTHTASSQAGTVSGFACTQCHKTEMKPEHFKSSSAFTMGSYSSKCAVCHEVAVDNLGAAWDKTCDDCHTPRHTDTATKHDATTAGAACGGAGCHAISDVAAIHSNSVSAVTSADTDTCATCHVDNNAVPTTLDCSSAGCHAGTAGHVAVHDTATSSPCVSCHEYGNVQGQHDPAVIGASISGKVNDGCNICHGGDGWTNVRASVTDPECVSCHNGTLVGTHAYAPADPQHYTPATAQHTASGTETGIANTGGNACSMCHSLEMKPEHAKSSTSFDLGGYADQCIACHELKVDNFSGAWDATCQACHATATVHTAFSGAHDFGAYDAANTLACSGADCHNVTAVDLIHAGTPADGITSSCASCHDASGPPTERLCTDCHSAHPNNTTVHTSAQTECTDCHTTYGNLANHSGGCAACHTDPTLVDYLQNNYSANCTDCHNASVLGTHAYTPADDQHYTPAITNHTATGMTTKVDGTAYDTGGGNTCADCHTGTLKVAHATTSVGAVTCVECHTDTTLGSAAQVAASWTNDACADCHTTSHTTYTTGTHTALLGTTGTADGCANAGCHNTGATNDVRLIHNRAKTDRGCTSTGTDSNGWSGSCHDLNKAMASGTIGCGSGTSAATKCHVNHTNSNHMPAHDATNATSIGCTTSGCHETLTVTTIHAGVADGCQPCHGGGGYTDIHTTAGNFECVTCHNGTLVGTHVYTPHDANHYTPAISNHTASGTETGISNTGGYACTQCHSLEMKPAHNGPTNISFNLSGYADKCIACHEIKVDAFAGAWDKTCQACHASATVHNGLGTAHDASAESMSSPGSTFGGGGGGMGAGFADGLESGDFSAWTTADNQGGSGTQVLSEDWETNSFNTNSWTRSSTTNVTIVTTPVHGGSRAARIYRSAGSGTDRSFTSASQNTSAGSATLSFWYQTSGINDGSSFDVDTSTNGSTWSTRVWTTSAVVGTWTQATVSLPTNTTTYFRFVLNATGTANNKYIYIDDIVVSAGTPTPTAGWGVQSAVKNAGTYAAEASGSGPQWWYLTKTGIDNSGAGTVDVSYDISWATLESADDVVVQYTTNSGGSWTDLKNYAPAAADPGTQAWKTETFTGLSSAIDGIRFGLYADNNTGDLLYIDAVSVTPVAAGGGAGSAATSCQNNPTGTECHIVTDVAAIHAATTAKCSICHKNNTTAPTKNCQTSGCHAGVNLDEHVEMGSGAAHHENGGTFTSFATGGECAGCHDDSIANEHFALSAYSAKPCSVCHATNYTVGTYSPAKATVTGRIAAGAIACDGCHTTSTEATPHVQRIGANGSAGGVQFSSTYSGHRVWSTYPGSKTGSFPGVSYTFTLPSSNTAWLNSGWTPTSMVVCTDCHGSVTGASGPHGASMAVNYAIRTGTTPYDNSYTAGTLYNNNGSMSNTTNLCAKCHPSNVVSQGGAGHTRSDHRGTSRGKCTICHSPVPHGWKRPRLLGRTSDPAPWRSTGLTGITGKNYTAGSWQEADCGTSCGGHNSTPAGTVWP